MERVLPKRRVWLVVLVVGMSPVVAQDDIRQERIAFAPGDTEATVQDTITGYDSVDYLVGARAGQDMSVTLETDNTANYFNIIPPNEENVATFVGSTSGNSFADQLDLDGDWKIRVYLMRSAARREETANFSLTVSVTGMPEAVEPLKR